MSTDPMYAEEPDRALDEDQERRAPSNEYPEASERGLAGDPDADVQGVEREDALGYRGEDRTDREEREERDGELAPSAAPNAVGTDRFGESDGFAVEETGYGAPAGTVGQTQTPTGYDTVTSSGYGSGNGTTATTNGHMDDVRDDFVIAPDQNTDFRARWREIQAEFIEDPQQAAQDADHLVAEITKVFAAQAEEQRNRLTSSWQQDGTHGTEELRLVMRHYRGLVDHMLDQ